ncbi:MAG: endonuclease/exonuclease/phosphatase family protein [Myxococcota bacterium]
MRLALISWNLHGAPPASRIIPRLRAVAREIERRSPDVVLLQEVWTRVQGRLISRRLPGYVRIDPPIDGWLRTGGLLTLVSRASGLHVLGSHFEPYTAHAPSWKLWEGDGLAHKGMLTVDLALDSERLSVTNTHLQASYRRGGYRQVRAAQLEQLRSAVARVDEGVPTLLGGDLNTHPHEDDLWGNLRNETLDLTRSYRERCGCGTSVGGNGWIDYVLARRDPEWSIDATRVDRILSRELDDPYSDHQGLDLQIEIQRTRSARAAGTLERILAPATRRAWLAELARLLVRGPLG